jgi:hypothetical protein
MTFCGPLKIYLANGSKCRLVILWLATEDGGRGGIGMVLQILLDGLIAQDKAESALRGDTHGRLQIELLEGNDVLDRFSLFEHRVMELLVGQPIIGDV